RPPRERLAPELVAVEPGDVDAVLGMIAGIGRLAHPVRDAPAAAEFHGARADDVHLRLLDCAVGLLDQRAGHAAPAELAREREPDRARADDQDRRPLGHVIPPLQGRALALWAGTAARRIMPQPPFLSFRPSSPGFARRTRAGIHGGAFIRGGRGYWVPARASPAQPGSLGRD